MPAYEHPDGHLEVVTEGGARHRELEAGYPTGPVRRPRRRRPAETPED